METSYYLVYWTGRMEQVDFDTYVKAFEDEAVRMLVEETV